MINKNQELVITGVFPTGGPDNLLQGVLSTGAKTRNVIVKKVVHGSAELEILLAFNHPQIVQVVHCEARENFTFFAMLQAKGDLFQYIVDMPEPDLKDALRIMHLILEAVTYIHDLGYVHCDLKPENVLWYAFGGDGVDQFQVTDFGEAIKCTEHEMTFVSGRGTPAYMAPEVYLGFVCCPKLDVWSMGCILYVLLYHNLPFEKHNVQHGTREEMAHAYSVFLFLDEYSSNFAPVPKGTKSIVSSMLEGLPQERIDSNKALSLLRKEMLLPTNVQHVAEHTVATEVA